MRQNLRNLYQLPDSEEQVEVELNSNVFFRHWVGSWIPVKLILISQHAPQLRSRHKDGLRVLVVVSQDTGRRRDGDAAPPRCPSDRTPSRDNDVVGGTGNGDGGNVRKGRRARKRERESTREAAAAPASIAAAFSCCAAAVQRATTTSSSFLPPKPRQPPKGKGERGERRRGGVPARPSAVVSRSVGLHDGRTGRTQGTGRRKGLRIKGPKKTTATIPIAVSDPL